MENVQQLINEIHNSISQKTASRKDEVRVMRAMLNDMDYKVAEYDKGEFVGTYCPAESARNIVSNVLQGTSNITSNEARDLANSYEFSKSDAENMIGISKEFIHSYLHTGRKMSIGGREKSDISMHLKEVTSNRPYPKVVGTDDKGNKIYGRGISTAGSYESIKIIASCPSWLR